MIEARRVTTLLQRLQAQVAGDSHDNEDMDALLRQAAQVRGETGR